MSVSTPQLPTPATRVPDPSDALDGRDRVVDLVRALSLLVVAFGHWLLAAVHVDGTGRASAANLLELAPWTRWLTWGAQVIGLFVLAGAFANATSWRGHSSRGGGYGSWLWGRAQRLLGPTIPFALVWTGLAFGLSASGVVDPALLQVATRLVAIVVWFLAVYVLLVAAAPVMLRLHDRYGLRVVAGLLLAASAVEFASRALGVPLLGWLQFPLVWGVVHQFGFFWQDGSLRRAGARVWWALAAGGFGALVLVTVVFEWYPVSMVGVPGAVRSNNSPPSLAIVLLGVAHLGVVMLAHARLTRWLRRPRVWRTTVTLGSISMSSYLWHLTGMLLVLGAALASPWRGTLLGAVPGSAGWWAERPLWLVAYGLAAVPFVAWSLRAERASLHRVRRVRPDDGSPAARPPAVPVSPVLAGLLLLCAALALLAGQGFSVSGWPGGLPLPALLVGGLGWWLLGVAITVREPAADRPGTVPPAAHGIRRDPSRRHR